MFEQLDTMKDSSYKGLENYMGLIPRNSRSAKMINVRLGKTRIVGVCFSVMFF